MMHLDRGLLALQPSQPRRTKRPSCQRSIRFREDAASLTSGLVNGQFRESFRATDLALRAGQ